MSSSKIIRELTALLILSGVVLIVGSIISMPI